MLGPEDFLLIESARRNNGSASACRFVSLNISDSPTPLIRRHGLCLETPRVDVRPSTRSSPKIACSTTPSGASTVATTRSIASRARSRRLTLTFDISQLPSPRNWAMAGGSNGYRAAPVRRQLTPGLISSLPETAGLPPFISFSTSYPELLDSVVRRLVHVPEASGGSRAAQDSRFLWW
jgi:hypothetical protein